MRYIDLAKYPIDRPTSIEGQALLHRCRASLASRGFVALDGFVTPETTMEVLAESDRLEAAGRGFYSTEQHGIFLTEETPPAGLPPNHPRMQQVSSSKRIFPADELPRETPLRAIHEWPPMVAFVKTALQLDSLHPSVCPLGAFYINVFRPGDQLGWHFDNSEFSVSLILRPADAGGAFEYAPHTRRAVAAMEALPPADRVGDALAAAAPPLRASSLYLFHGRHSLHRVSPVRAGKRVNAILTYNSGPGERLNAYTLRKFFGRTKSLRSLEEM